MSKLRMPAAWALALVLTACACAPAAAGEQDDRIKALEQKLEESLRLIRSLSDRVQELERAQRPAGASTAASSPDAGNAIAALQNSVKEISEGLSRGGQDTGSPLHGFADVTATWGSRGDPQHRRGFGGGTLDFYITPQFNRVKALFELNFEYEPDGEAVADVERLQLGYALDDALTLWAGRFHTPFGLWNTWFHHGVQLQTSATRPRFVDFEDNGGLLPAHSVGLWAGGKRPVGGSKLLYDVYVANGPRLHDRRLDFNPFNDNDGNKLVGANLGLQPAGRDGLTVGLHGFTSRVKSYDSADTLIGGTRVRMMGGYFGFDDDVWEAIGEYYHFDNRDLLDGGHHDSNVWFLHLARTWHRTTPYVRYERASLATGDRYFRSLPAGRSYERALVGARYELDPRAALKLELSHTREKEASLLDENGAAQALPAVRYRRIALQYSIAF